MKNLFVILLILAFLGLAALKLSGEDFPPMLPLPPAGLTPQQELEWNGLVIGTNRISPPRMPKVAEWKDGKILELEQDRFTICLMSKWYDVYHCTDLIKGDWMKLSRLDSEDAVNDRMKYYMGNCEGYWRVVEVKKPYPPTAINGFGLQMWPTNHPAGGFRK